MPKPEPLVRTLLRRLGSFLPGDPTSAPATNATLVQPRPADYHRAYPSVGITPSRVLTYLHAADAGDPRIQFELFTEMLQKWPRLRAVESTRRLALTGLDWEVTPARVVADENPRATLAQAAADHCATTLLELPALRPVLDHLASAIGFGIAVAELVWDAGRLVDLVPVPFTRLITDPREPWRLRILTADQPTAGVPLDAFPHKWIVHRPRCTPGHHFDRGLLRASVLLYLAQNLSFKDWLIYSQIAGMPVRIARFEPGMPEQDKRQLLNMLERLGTDAVAMVSKNVEIDFANPGRGDHQTYPRLQDYCNTEITILWLGQHLTTDVRSSGSRAAAEIHDRVREDLLVDDIADEAQTLRCDLLTPITRARFGPAAPVPHFQRSLVEASDTRALADTLAVAVRDLGLRVPRRWAHRALGIPEAGPADPTLNPEDLS